MSLFATSPHITRRNLSGLIIASTRADLRLAMYAGAKKVQFFCKCGKNAPTSTWRAYESLLRDKCYCNKKKRKRKAGPKSPRPITKPEEQRKPIMCTIPLEQRIREYIFKTTRLSL